MELSINWNSLIFYSLTAYLLYSLYKKFIFPALLNYVMKQIHGSLHENIKKKAFKEAFDKVSSSSNEQPIEVLEVGVGTGENFKFFPQTSKITYLDKTDEFLPFLRRSLEKEKLDSDGVKLIVSKAENMKDIESNSKDVVVHTFILCSVEDPRLVLSEIHRVLKPGGICVFIEHSLDDENLLRRLFQKLIAPLWLCLLDCKFRPMKSILSAGKYEELKMEFHRGPGCISSIINPYVYGIGTKQ